MNRTLLRILGALLLVGAVTTALLYREHLDVAALEARVGGAGAAAPLIFIGLYVLATVLFLPGAVLTLAGGALFGPLWGTPYNLVGATIGAAVAFLPRLIARLRQRPMLPIEGLKRRLEAKDEDILVLDVRTPEDFVGEQGHIAGALNIPLESLPERIEALGSDLERPIALVCRTDRRSAKAAALLAGRGFGQVQVVRGGMTAWLANGWPVEQASPQAD
jgi:rhodanese-related sulfurtransferase